MLLPDYLHCIWRLLDGDAEFGKHQAMIKRFVTKRCAARLKRKAWVNEEKSRRNESTLWQCRYWEYLIREENDINRHWDYIHFNPVKDSFVGRVVDWLYSTYYCYVEDGVRSNDWSCRGLIILKRILG